MVAEHGEHARGGQARELVGDHRRFVAAPAHVVAGEHDEVGLRRVGGGDRGAHVLPRRGRTDVDVGELGDPHAVVARIEVPDPDLVLRNPRRRKGHGSSLCAPEWNGKRQ